MSASRTPDEMPFVQWAKITGFHNVCSSMAKCKEYAVHNKEGFAPFDRGLKEALTYKGKVKLHGENAAVSIQPSGRVRTQSRNRQLDFYAGVSQLVFGSDVTERYFRTLLDGHPGVDKSCQQVTVFGEWCGPGVQKNVALNEIPHKIFAVFSIQFTLAADDDEARHVVMVDPDQILAFMTKGGTVALPERVHILPWHTEEYTFDFRQPAAAMEPKVHELNQLVEGIDKEDPWVKSVFHVAGTGEGLVLYPLSLAGDGGLIEAEALEAFMFKAKGQGHQVVKSTKSVQVKAQTAEGVDEFVKLVCAEARMEQGAKAVGGSAFSKKNTGRFVAWLKKDVKDECKDEMGSLTWAQVQGAVAKEAARWYGRRCPP